MHSTPSESISGICRNFANDRTRLLDIAMTVQKELGCVDDEAMDEIARTLSIPRVDVESLVSFYSFLSRKPKGKIVIRLCNDIIDRMKGAEAVARSLEEELGIRFGETTPDGKFTLEYTSCIGMSDQAPAALVNDLVVTRLGPGAARRGANRLQARNLDEIEDLSSLLVRDYGDGNNSHDLVRSPVHNNIRVEGDVIFEPMEPGAALSQALAMRPAEVIRQVKTARLRGRGGAGFPTGMKWEFTRATVSDQRYIICNADEGEPGTFKDRVILTERPDLLFEGMTVAGYAIGATQGVLYLRGEYAYLRDFLENVLAERRRKGLLGREICDKFCFDFDIRIQMGAGAYICGEETALISSAEGLRGDPRNRPPFPAQNGYLGKPTSVNNVETLCCVARILEKGSGWFASMGTAGSTGTKLLSVSGDCRKPGVYEVPFGITLRKVFELCGADAPLAAQVGGPSGEMVGEDAFDRKICFDDLSTGGALMVFGRTRNPIEIVSAFLEFFIHESCGHCTPCRVGNVLLKERIDKILAGRGEPEDLAYLDDLAATVKTASRCGLGQTSPNPVLSTLEHFRPHYEQLLKPTESGRQPGFDLEATLSQAMRLTGREPVHGDGEEVEQ
jgi:[NiFe] hydrogenase diaphorase moiety large subunit